MALTTVQRWSLAVAGAVAAHAVVIEIAARRSPLPAQPAGGGSPANVVPIFDGRSPAPAGGSARVLAPPPGQSAPGPATGSMPQRTSAEAPRAATSSGEAGSGSAAGPDSLDQGCWIEVGRELGARAQSGVPGLVRDRGLAGTMALSFRVGEGGVIGEARVMSSSGHEALDRAVLAVLARPLATSCRGRGRWSLRFHPSGAPSR